MLLRQLREALAGTDEEALEALVADREQEVETAFRVVEWWRALHARPLARVNAGLRYYIRKAGCEQSEVSQRLKRFSTVIDKLSRRPATQLTTMEDIGGVRAIMPQQDQIDEVVRCLQRAERRKIRRLRQYIDGGDPGPKADGYRAVHVVVEKNGCFVEITTSSSCMTSPTGWRKSTHSAAITRVP